jgi:hypothetical protein
VSELSRFANAAFTTASTVIGTRTITISGGTAVAGVVNDVVHERDFEGGGFAPTRTLDIVCNAAAFKAAYTAAFNTYIGNTAVVNSVTYRVGGIEDGVSTTTIRLTHNEEA